MPNLTITLDKSRLVSTGRPGLLECGVRTYSKVPLTQGQYDALTDFAFNLGIGALRDSTLMKEGQHKDFCKLRMSLASGYTRAAKCCRVLCAAVRQSVRYS